MTPHFPYTFYACPCSEEQTQHPHQHLDDNELDQERTFNPHDPLSAYSLYTLDHLLYCDDCNQIRCAKCVSDEIINWYCPNCLFEVPSSSIKSDGNRCSRNCYSCPLCTSPLTVSQLDSTDEETYLLTCHYCAWSSLDIDLKFDRPTKLTDQLKKSYRARFIRDMAEEQDKRKQVSAEERFERYTAFYKNQLVECGETPTQLGFSGYGSPANIARIVNLYGGLSQGTLMKSQSKTRPMREVGVEEGLTTYTAATGYEDELVEQMQTLEWEDTASDEQRLSAPSNYDARTTEELWPIAIQLRTRRGKRCRQCRQFVIRPDAKITSTRYRLRIIAANHVPRLSVRPLDNSAPVINPSFILKNDIKLEQPLLKPFTPQQYVLTLRNPIFETIRISLATPAITPGKVATKVTILCPAFSIGPAGDVWDEALSPAASGHGDGSIKAAMASLVGNEVDRQPEAGKVWEQTRNSTSVVLEIVPGAVPADAGGEEDVLEIPIYVSVEWMAEAAREGEQKGTTERVQKELAYWCVLGVGRIAR